MDDEPVRPIVPRVGADNWVQSLAFEIALGYFTPEELQLKFDLTPEAYDKITGMTEFRKAEADYRREVDDEGIAFRLRARKCAEEILSELYAISFDRTVQAKDRLKAMEMLCKYAGFETQKQEGDGGVKLVINTNLSLNDDLKQTYTIEIPNDHAQIGAA